MHLHAAEQIAQGHPPRLPSGHVYDRSVSFTYLVAWAGVVGTFDEFTLRVPSAVFGVLVVVLVYWVTARWFSISAGLAAAFMTTFSPIEIAHSREVRMYMLFQFCFLLLMFFFYEGFERSSPSNEKRAGLSQIQTWFVAWEIRPLFLLMAGIMFGFSWTIHPLIIPGVSGFLVYILVMGGMAMVVSQMDGSIRQKYIMVSLGLLVSAGGCVVFFSEQLSKLLSVTDDILSWGQENSENWSYYRWLLLDEYPIVFGSLTLLLPIGLVKNPKLTLFLTLAFLVPVVMHSTIFPQKGYRYIFHLLPLLYMLAGVGFAQLLAMMWSEGMKLNSSHFVSNTAWNILLVGGLSVALVGMLANMPWFVRTLKDYNQNFQSPHVTDVQHHHWKGVMTYISQHEVEGDVMVCAYPLLCHYYGTTQPIYFMNNAYWGTNQKENLRDQQGNLLDYTFGAIVLHTLEDFKHIFARYPSGWLVTYRWRTERFWNVPDHQFPVVGTFPPNVIEYVQDHSELQLIPGASDMAVWRWGQEKS